MLSFYKTNDIYKIADILASKIGIHLQQGSVLWLIGGGSVIDIAVQTADKLSGVSNLSKLTVTLTDERYGALGHADSNWRQLISKGFLLAEANLEPVLKGSNLEITARDYSKSLEREISAADYSIALGGIGADGHIFGIKPHSPAIGRSEVAIGYQGPDYARVTPTLALIKKLDEIIIFAAGAEKHDQLDRIELELTAQEQPAQLLKRARQVSIYNDYKGERL